MRTSRRDQTNEISGKERSGGAFRSIVIWIAPACCSPKSKPDSHHRMPGFHLLVPRANDHRCDVADINRGIIKLRAGNVGDKHKLLPSLSTFPPIFSPDLKRSSRVWPTFSRMSRIESLSCRSILPCAKRAAQLRQRIAKRDKDNFISVVCAYRRTTFPAFLQARPVRVS